MAWSSRSFRRPPVLTIAHVGCLAINDSGHVFAGMPGSVIRSIDNGASWTAVNTGLSSVEFSSRAINRGGLVFVGTMGSGVFRSTDNGASWMAVNAGLTNRAVRALAISGNGLVFTGTMGDGVFRGPRI